MRWYLIVAGVLIGAVLWAGTCLPVQEWSRQNLCLECGLIRHDHRFLGILSTSYQRQPFTDWYDRRIGDVHEHVWEEDSGDWIIHKNLWGRVKRVERGSMEPGIAINYINFNSLLRRLEPLDLDVPFWIELKHSDPRHRTEANSVSWQFTNGTDLHVRQWWIEAMSYLGEPAAWKAGFKVYSLPP